MQIKRFYLLIITSPLKGTCMYLDKILFNLLEKLKFNSSMSMNTSNINKELILLCLVSVY